MENFLNLLPFFVAIAIALVVIFTELIKKLDKNSWLKGYRIYIPMVLSFVFAFFLKIGNFFATEQFLFWWVTIFGISIFGYETILRKILNAIGSNEKSS